MSRKSVIVLIHNHHDLLDLIMYLCLITISVVSQINKHDHAHYQCGGTIFILKHFISVDILP